MLSSVLNSARAVKVNIAIMRAFVKLRETLETNRELARKFAELERRVGKHDEKIEAILTHAPGNGAPIGGIKVVAQRHLEAGRRIARCVSRARRGRISPSGCLACRRPAS